MGGGKLKEDSKIVGKALRNFKRFGTLISGGVMRTAESAVIEGRR